MAHTAKRHNFKWPFVPLSVKVVKLHVTGTAALLAFIGINKDTSIFGKADNVPGHFHADIIRVSGPDGFVDHFKRDITKE
ncbi:MAG: hypothetical protein IMZ62_17235 [Chloroflexi bacterium]|nr:hypothetical protein [Chloroflexota bacterium]